MLETALSFSSSSPSCAKIPERHSSSRPTILWWPHMPIVLFVSWTAKLANSTALTTGLPSSSKEGPDDDESFNVRRLYISVAAQGRAANNPGGVLRGGWRDGDCLLAARRLHAAELADRQRARYEWWRYRGDRSECATQRERPVLLQPAPERWHHLQLHRYQRSKRRFERSDALVPVL